jgi:hypothetical protein
MANKLDNLKRGEGFDKYPERINRKGRPLKLASRLNRIGYTNSQVIDTIKNIFALTEDEVKHISKSEEYTILERSVSAAILKDLSNGNMHNLELLVSRCFGKPRDTTYLNTEKTVEVVFLNGKTILN